MALTDTKRRLPADHPGVVDPVDREQLDGGVLVQPVVEAPGPEAEGGDHLVAAQVLGVPVATPASTRSMTPSESSSVCTPRSRWPPRPSAPPSGWRRSRPGWSPRRGSARRRARAIVRSSASARRAAPRQAARRDSHQPATWTEVELVLPEGPGHAPGRPRRRTAPGRSGWRCSRRWCPG